ncbi:MAG: hypothetical protein AB8I08_00880 [Sandaracinaceae bacterium]
MFDQPLFLVGAVVTFAGTLLFGGLLFSNGGVRKSRQFRVIRELLGGTHGNGARLLTVAALLSMASGSCLLFSGVAASDHERAERCERRCRAEGYEAGRIGPNSDRTEDRSTWWVACICEGGSAPVLELRADERMSAGQVGVPEHDE